MLSSRTSEKGSYLLEVAVVTMGLVFFIVGASDVARIFQARGAVRAGVREGLRCLYPTDPGCSGAVSPGPSSPSTLFDAWVWKSGMLYAVPHQPWTAAASWIAEPGLETPQVERSIQSVDIEQKKYRFEQQEVLYPVQAHAPYLLQVRSFPQVSGTPLNPTFVIPGTTTAMSHSAMYGLVKVNKVTKLRMGSGEDGLESKFKIGSRTFNIKNAWESSADDTAEINQIQSSKGVTVPCYSGTIQQGATGQTLQWPQGATACQYRNSSAPLWGNGKLHVPLMFQISGTSSVKDGAKGGSVLISMSWKDADNKPRKKDLGGRIFSGGGGANGNFIVRGAAFSDIINEDPYIKNYNEEIKAHGTLPLIPVDADVTIDFFLVSADGQQVSWQGGDLKLFYPSFKFVHETFDCDYSADPATCAKPPAYVKTLYSEVNLSQQLTLNTPPAAVCQRTEKEGYEPDPSRRLQEISSCISTTGSCSSRCIDLGGCNPAPHRFWTGDLQPSGACEVINKNYLCDELKKRYLMGCVPPDDLSKIPPECPVSDFNPVLDKLSKINYPIVIQVMGVPDKRLACSGEPLPECANPHRSVTKEEEVWPVTLERAQQCSDARFRTPGSFTTDPLPVNYCIDRGAELEKEYREKNKVPISVPIPIIPGEKKDQYQSAPPTDICIPSTPVDGEIEKSLCGERLSRSAAYQCCKDNGERCKLKPIVDLKPGDPVNNDDKLFLSAAAKRVVDTVQVGYPPAQRLNTCDGKAKNCLAVSTKLIDDRKRAQVSAEVTVPLQLSALFGSNGVTVRHDETRLMEHTFLAE